MPIHPLPQFEADLAEHLKEEADREAYERLNAPKTLVVRFGYLKMVGEFPWKSDEKPGCGSKIVVRTHRGTEIGEMLTSTCPNSGCSKSVSRKEMLDYIQNSGGRQYPFSTDGRALRIATTDDLNEQTRIEQSKHALRTAAKRQVERLGLDMRIVEAEPLLGGERVTFYFSSEERIDFRDLVTALQKDIGVRADMRQVGARDEARVAADYERCGQYCCCKNFLKVLKPVSMKSAKIQKATLDPLKISGRCGRLMCCLRYEDETYDQLRKNLPHRKSRVGTPEGDGIVIDSQILTQLALVRLDSGTDVAIPIEELTPPESATAPEPGTRSSRPAGRERQGERSRRSAGKKREKTSKDLAPKPESSSPAPSETDAPKKKRRRRKKRSTQGGTPEAPRPQTSSEPQEGGQDQSSGEPQKKRRKRRRRRKPGGGQGPSGGADTGGGSGD